MAVLMFVCRLGARRQIHHRLKVPTVTAYLARLACQALHRVPHGDTVADLVGTLLVEELADLRTGLVRSLLERRRLEGFRLLGTDYLFTLDGTGHLALGDRPSRFTEGCLTQKLSNGTTLYYRYVLEAKLVARSSLALSVGTEFVENVPREGRSDEEYKQDCELQGAYRLLPTPPATRPHSRHSPPQAPPRPPHPTLPPTGRLDSSGLGCRESP